MHSINLLTQNCPVISSFCSVNNPSVNGSFQLPDAKLSVNSTHPLPRDTCMHQDTPVTAATMELPFDLMELNLNSSNIGNLQPKLKKKKCDQNIRMKGIK